jgi:cell division protein FtsZ
VRILFRNLLPTGVGGNLLQGQRAAERCAGELAEVLAGSTEVYVVAGMGGGTGSGAAPVVAQMAWEAGATVTAVVTRPFSFEGTLRASTAARGIALMEQRVHRLVVFNADRLLPFLAENPALDQAYTLLAQALAWQVLVHLV